MIAPSPPVPFPTRPRDAHKGSVGTVLVVAGSRGMAGAAFLAGEAALRTGAGLVTVGSPAAAQRVVEVKTTCAMTRPLPETDAGTLAHEALAPLLELASSVTALAVGPGLSRHPVTAQVVRDLVARLAARDGPPLVLDADGLNAFEGRPGDLAALAPRLVLTPHPGELVRLAGCAREQVARDRRGALSAFVARVGAVTLLKGAGTLVARRAPDGRVEVHENDTGNPGLATGGSGDVLTGVIGALLAAGLSAWDAARLGAWLHGRAGDLVARRTGWAPMIASDLLEGLIEAIREVEVRDAR